MANLELVENCFFETPLDVADELAAIIRPFLTRSSNLLIVDACAGAGALGAAVLRASAPCAHVSFVETNPQLLQDAFAANRGQLHGPLAPLDVFSVEASELLAKADLVTLNPPFAGSRGEQLSDLLAALQEADPYPDIGCHYILHVARQMSPGVPMGFVFRRNAFYSRSYRRFWTELGNLGAVLELRGMDRRLRPNSGAAESVIGVFVSGVASRRCWLRQRASEDEARQAALLRKGWRRLADVAQVRAGPSITSSLKGSGRAGPRTRKVIDIPTGHDGEVLWGPEFTFEMDWTPSSFSVPRNLGCQGSEGFAYKLAASEFRTAILPAGHHFLSATPAVIPKKPYDLSFVIGCSLLPSWRQMVRDRVGSSNFTPGAVAEVFVPFSSFDLYRRVSELGEAARSLVKDAVSRRTAATLFMPREVGEIVARTDDLVSCQLGELISSKFEASDQNKQGIGRAEASGGVTRLNPRVF